MKATDQAFPGDNESWGPSGGLSIRDYIAIQAMMGLLSRERIPFFNVVEESYRTADAMILESNKEQKA